MNHLPLRILRCPLSYPVRDGIPVLVIAEATARPIETDPEFERLVAEALAAPFSGWDRSWLQDRRTEGVDPPGGLMDLYESRARDLEVGESFREAGLRISTWAERSTATTYHDIGAVVYTLLHLPRAVADFDLERYRQRLYRLHRRVQAEGGFTTRGAGYLIEARKP